MMHINNKNDLSYVKHMKGWYLEVYKGDKYLSTSIIDVFRMMERSVITVRIEFAKLMLKYIFFLIKIS